MKLIKQTYKNKVKTVMVSAVLAAIGLNSPALHAQVTIGSEYVPTRAALLELKDRQTGTVTSVSDPDNATSTSGGLLLPRVELVTVNDLRPFIATTVFTDSIALQQALSVRY
jgi:hypothetical protein